MEHGVRNQGSGIRGQRSEDRMYISDFGLRIADWIHNYLMPLTSGYWGVTGLKISDCRLQISDFEGMKI